MFFIKIPINMYYKSIITFALAAAATTTVFAQEAKQYPEPEPMTHKMTEFWEPQPPVVIPGDQCTQSAPSDAIVLFDGKDLSKWQSSKTGGPAEWQVKDGVVTVDKSKGDIQTRDKFGSCQLHIEWCVPKGIEGSSQSRGNSGIFFQGLYELQVLDNYKNVTYSNGMVGSMYKQGRPLVNPMRKPGEWNVYDIIYTAPIFKADGTYLYKPYITVLLNGVLVEDHFEIQGTTEYIGLPQVKKHGDGPIILQAHGDKSQPISFRNIWIRPLN